MTRIGPSMSTIRSMALGRIGFMDSFKSRVEISNKIKKVKDGIQKELDLKSELIEAIDGKRCQLFAALMDKVRLKLK